MGRRLLSLAALGGPLWGGGLTPLMRDTFTTDRAAGAVHGTAAEPGPDDTRTVTDTLGGITISGGNLLFAQNVYQAIGDPGIWWQARSRTPGLAMVGKVYHKPSSYLALGFDSDQTGTGANTESVYLYSDKVRVVETGVAGSAFVISEGYYYFAVVLLSQGANHFLKGGPFAQLTKLWHSWFPAHDPIYPAIMRWQASGNQSIVPEFALYQLSGEFASLTGFQFFDEAAANGMEYSATDSRNLSPGNMEACLEVQAPASLDGNPATRTGLYYRTDAGLENGWHAYFDGTGAFRLDSLVAGVRTNRVNVASTISANAKRTIKVRAIGTKHECQTGNDWVVQRNNTVWTIANPTLVDVSLNDTETRCVPVAASGWTLGRIAAFPMTSSAFNQLDALLTF